MPTLASDRISRFGRCGGVGLHQVELVPGELQWRCTACGRTWTMTHGEFEAYRLGIEHARPIIDQAATRRVWNAMRNLQSALGKMAELAVNEMVVQEIRDARVSDSSSRELLARLPGARADQAESAAASEQCAGADDGWDPVCVPVAGAAEGAR